MIPAPKQSVQEKKEDPEAKMPASLQEPTAEQLEEAKIRKSIAVAIATANAHCVDSPALFCGLKQ